MALKIYSCLFLIFSSLVLIQGVTTEGRTATIEVPKIESSSTSEPHILMSPMHSLKDPPLYPPLHLNQYLYLHHALIANAIESGILPQLPFDPFPIYSRLPSQPIPSQIPTTNPYRMFPWGVNPITQEQQQSQGTEREGKIEESRASKMLQSQSNTPQIMNNTEMEFMNNSTLEQVNNNSTNTTKPIDKSAEEKEPIKPPKRVRIPRIFRNICYREHNCRGGIIDLDIDALQCRNRHGQAWKLTRTSPCINLHRRAEPQYWLNDNEEDEEDGDGNYDDDDDYMTRRRRPEYKTRRIRNRNRN